MNQVMINSITGRTKRRFSIIGLASVPVIGGAASLVSGQTPIFYAAGFGSNDVVAADVNRDGAMDLVVASSDGGINILLNDGTGAFPDRVTLESGEGIYIDAGDLDGDYDIDLITGGPGSFLNILLNDGHGGFGDPTLVEVSNSVRGIELVDVTGDGVLDIALSEHRSSTAVFEVYLNDGAGSFTPGANEEFSSRSASRFSVTSGDLDGDGDQDVVTMNQGSGGGFNYYGVHVHIMLNNGDGTSWGHQRQIFDQGDFVGKPWCLVSGDVDRDGDIDLAYNEGGEPDGSLAPIAILANNGSATFRERLFWLPSWDYNLGVAAGDMDGEGQIDLTAISELSGEYRAHVLLELNYQRDAGRTTGHPPSGDVEVPDLNGDGMRDIVAVTGAGVLVTLNGFIPDRPSLSQSDLVRGESATFTVSDANAGERVYFLYSLNGVDSTAGIRSLGYLSLDLAWPITQIASIRADDSGVAQATVRVPGRAPLNAIVATQAAIRRGVNGSESVKTNFITAPIRD